MSLEKRRLHSFPYIEEKGGNCMAKKEMCASLQKSVQAIIQEVSEDICDNYCKFRETADEDNLCDVIRNGSPCPLDRLQ